MCRFDAVNLGQGWAESRDGWFDFRPSLSVSAFFVWGEGHTSYYCFTVSEKRFPLEEGAAVNYHFWSKTILLSEYLASADSPGSGRHIISKE
jgi:hypothetical protein